MSKPNNKLKVVHNNYETNRQIKEVNNIWDRIKKLNKE